MRLTPHPTPDHPTHPTHTNPPSTAQPTARRRRRRVLLPLAAAALAAAVVVLAAVPALADGGVRVVALAGSVDEVLNNLRNWLMGILAGLATVFLTVGGVRYLMAGGDPGEVEKAKTAFKSAGWGYAAAALAPLVVTVLKGLVGA
ncbi:MAG TPA: pilin, partial [Mycobacteriales bacterium]|nr:pilin [Mycobacteriales bacterium]